MKNYFSLLFLYSAVILFSILGAKNLSGELYALEMVMLLLLIFAAAALSYRLLYKFHDRNLHTFMLAALFFNSFLLMIKTSAVEGFVAALISLVGMLYIFMKRPKKKTFKRIPALEDFDRLNAKPQEKEFIREIETQDELTSQLEDELSREAMQMSNAEKEAAHLMVRKEKEDAVIEELKEEMEKIRKSKNIKFKK